MADHLRINALGGGFEEHAAGVAQQSVGGAEHDRGDDQRGDAVRPLKPVVRITTPAIAVNTESRQVRQQALEGPFDVHRLAIGLAHRGSPEQNRGTPDPVGGRGSPGELLGLVAITPDGLEVRQDGSQLRALEVGAVNPLIMNPVRADRGSRSFTPVAARIHEGQSLQLHVQAAPGTPRW